MGEIVRTRARKFGIRLHLSLFKAALLARTEYRIDFAIALLTSLMTQLAALTFYWVLSSSTSELGGWPPAMVLFLHGMTAMALGLSELCLNGIWLLPWYVVGGDLDRLLLYPIRPLNFLLVARPELHGLGNLGLGAVLIGVCWNMAELPLWEALLVPIWVLSGALIYNAGLVLVGCLSFRLVGPWTQQFMFVHQLLHAARYPPSVYPRWLQLCLMTVFPIGVATFLPARWLLGAESLWLTIVLPPVLAALLTLIAHCMWDVALRGYQSTGS